MRSKIYKLIDPEMKMTHRSGFCRAMVMAFSLSMTVNAQTNSTTEPAATAAEPTFYAGSGNKRILIRLGGKTVPDNLSAEDPTTVKNANISGESERNDLLKLAEALAYQSRRLKREAESKTGNEKDQLLAEAAQFERNCLLKQIEASEIFGTISQIRFNSNKETIQKLLLDSKPEESKVSRTRVLIQSSEKNMQIAKALRQESRLTAGLEAKLGQMNNAEEKEVLALGEQSQAITLLWKKPSEGM